MVTVYVSKFVSKYYDKVLSSLSSYRNNQIEQALLEASFMLDSILKMENVNQFLGSLKNLSDCEFEFVFEFLKFSALTNELISAGKGSQSKILDENSSDEVQGERKNSTATTGSPTDDSSNDGKSNDLFLNNCTISSQRMLQDEAYTFGGLLIDQHVSIDKSLLSYKMGTTANIVLLKDGYCYVSNGGDSLAVLYKNGKAYKLNIEHKISHPKERERIIKAGYTISNDRIEGRLNLTRALGDFMYKDNQKIGWENQAVTCFPNINKFKVTSDMEFLVMGCDGIWECVNIQKFCEFISKKLHEKVPLSLIMREALSLMVSKNSDSSVGMDNMTSILIQFNHSC